MADNVIHGTGKPRFVLPTGVILTDKTVGSSTSTSVTLAEATDLTTLDAQYGLAGYEVWTKNSSAETTYGVIQSYNDGTDTLTVDEWSNGNPNATAALYIQGIAIDLPYCQRLTETFTPDFITKKLLSGNIVRIKRGFYYSASLDYARYFHKDEMEVIRRLFNKIMNGCGFYPRVDNKALFYAVDIDPESSISFYQLKNHQGHGGIIINIIGTQRLASIPFLEPSETGGYGEDYGESYGYGL